MEFRTIFERNKSDFEIGYDTPTLALGSCFAENMGERLTQRKLPILTNPTGIVFNPVSLAESLDMITEGYSFSETDIFFDQYLWQSFRLHGQFSSVEKAEILGRAQQAISEANFFWKNANRLILTLGTAWIFEHRESGRVVANCHRIAAEQFHRRRLSVAECVAILQKSLEKQINEKPDLKIILSVSPVRHLKDGFAENSRSKSTLILAIDELTKLFPESVFYFPAYEILLDDLRDYRFYADDLAHPSNVAVDYIFQKFEQTFFTPKTQQIGNDIIQILEMEQHRPRNPHTPAHKAFLNKLAQRKQIFSQKNPLISF